MCVHDGEQPQNRRFFAPWPTHPVSSSNSRPEASGLAKWQSLRGRIESRDPAPISNKALVHGVAICEPVRSPHAGVAGPHDSDRSVFLPHVAPQHRVPAVDPELPDAAPRLGAMTSAATVRHPSFAKTVDEPRSILVFLELIETRYGLEEKGPSSPSKQRFELLTRACNIAGLC